MAIFKCKMCGGNLETVGESSVATCEYCGSVQTLPKKNDEVITNLFNRANNLRIKCEFDKAAEVYEKILNEDNNDSEAHWGLVLCKYGIEYVEDPKTYKRIPTCHRTQFEAVLSDVDYLAAMANADPVSAGVYKAQAEQIANLQKDILTIVSNEKPFDVFICYKETDANGKRTVDSALANDIYYQLTQEGLKVFYAAITLEDKLGYEYEPYIFAALNSSKVMLVVGTKPEHFEAVWVKNEWSRYLKLMKSDRSKLLIPCYRDMDAYDLPEEFSHLQAQDMGKIGFVNDVVRGIKKVIGGAPVAASVAAEPAAVAGVVNVAPLLKRAFMFLEDGDFKTAYEYCEKVLDTDPECAEAYLGKLMAELGARKRETLADAEVSFENNANFAKAVRFGSDELKAELGGYVEAIKRRAFEAELRCRYNDAVAKMNSAKIYTQFYDAKKLFDALGNYSNSAELAQQCEKRAMQIEFEAKQSVYEETLELEKMALEFLNRQTVVATITEYENLGDYKDSKARKDAFRQKVLARCDEFIKEGRYEKVAALSSVISDTEAGAQKVKLAKEKLVEEGLKEKAKRKKLIIIASAVGAALVAAILMFFLVIKPGMGYMKASKYEKDGNKTAAAMEYGKLGSFMGSKEKSFALWNEIAVRETVSAGEFHTVGLKSDGTVVAVGSDSSGQRNVNGWTDIVAVSAGARHTVGLKSDGTVVAVGDNYYYGRFDVESWTDIVAVSAGVNHTVGLESDGTVVAVGYDLYRQCSVGDWTDIVAVSAGENHTVGLKSDGTVVAVGKNDNGQCDVKDWTDIVAISAGDSHTVGLKSDGTVVAVGVNDFGQCNVDGWTDVVAITAGYYNTVGLKSDGRVVAVGRNGSEQSDVDGWHNIVAVSAGEYHTVGLKSDGTVVAVGSNASDQCDVDGWKIKLP